MRETIVGVKVDSRQTDLSKFEVRLCDITDVYLVQTTGTVNKKLVDEISKAGFQDDTVYMLDIQKPNDLVSSSMLRVNPDLQLLMSQYKGIEKPEDLAGHRVYVLIKDNMIKGFEPYYS